MAGPAALPEERFMAGRAALPEERLQGVCRLGMTGLKRIVDI